MQRFRQVPDKRSERMTKPFWVVGEARVARRFDNAMRVQRLVPLVIDRSLGLFEKERSVLVLYGEALMESSFCVVRIDVHLANARTVITGFREPSDPGRLPLIEVPIHIEHVRKAARE